MLHFLFFIVCCLALYGPKIGLIDISILAGPLGLLLISINKSLKIPRDYIYIVAFAALIFTYSIIVPLLFNSHEEYMILRNLRALIASFTLSLVAYNFPLSLNKKIETFIYVLGLNAIVVLVQFFMPDTKAFFAGLYGFDKSFVALRSFGLTAGYDSAGYLCVIGIILTFFSIHYRNLDPKYAIAMVLFAISSLLTSRSTMLLSVFFIVLFSLIFVFKGTIPMRILALLFLVSCIAVLKYYLLPLYGHTFSFLSIFKTYDTNNYVKSFAVTDAAEWRENMWILPSEPLHLILGGLPNPPSDLGYVKIIFMGGLISLAMTISLYIFMLMRVLYNQKVSQLFNKDTRSIDIKIISQAFILIVVLHFIFNIKNLYFLTRGYYELVILIYFTIMSQFNKHEQKADATGQHLTESL